MTGTDRIWAHSIYCAYRDGNPCNCKDVDHSDEHDTSPSALAKLSVAETLQRHTELRWFVAAVRWHTRLLHRYQAKLPARHVTQPYVSIRRSVP